MSEFSLKKLKHLILVRVLMPLHPFGFEYQQIKAPDFRDQKPFLAREKETNGFDFFTVCFTSFLSTRTRMKREAVGGYTNLKKMVEITALR